MSVYTNWISGVCVGFELYDDLFESGVILDLFIVRVVFLSDKS